MNTHKKQFFNIDLNVYTEDEVFRDIHNILDADVTRTIFFLNAHCFNVAQKNKEYRRSLKESDLLLNDGIGLKIGSFFTGIRFKGNLNGTDLIPKILRIAAKKGNKVFFLGGKTGVADKAAKKASKKIDHLNISGCQSGYFSKDEEGVLINQIIEKRTDILVVGMGVPRQELWCQRNKEKLKRVKLIIAGGAILDFLSEEITRAPVWMRKTGLEWVYRLYLEPGRMWKRYLWGNLVFFYYVFKLKRA